MFLSPCICKGYRASKFKKFIEYKDETIFKDFEGTIIGKCINCGVLKTFPFKNKFFNPKQSNASFYENNQDLFLSFFEPILEKIKRIKDKSVVLDVGCSSGLLIGLLKKNGYDTYGIEPNKKAFKVANKRFKKRVFYGVLKDFLKRKKIRFDVIIYNHVLEHIDNPLEEFRLIRRTLKKNGVLVIGVPNTKNLIFFLRRKYWESLMPAEHVWHFSTAYILSFLKQKGFKPIDISFFDHDRKDYPFLKRIYFQLLSLINKLFNTGEAVLIVALNTL